MKGLSFLLATKIVVTFFSWALPLIFFSEKFFLLFGPVPQPILFIRLLGVAYLALVVGYSWGWVKSRQGEKVDEILWVGAVSNGGAFLTLSLNHYLEGWAEWTTLGQAYLWYSLVATLLLAVSFLFFLARFQKANSK